LKKTDFPVFGLPARTIRFADGGASTRMGAQQLAAILVGLDVDIPGDTSTDGDFLTPATQDDGAGWESLGALYVRALADAETDGLDSHLGVADVEDTDPFAAMDHVESHCEFLLD
jgi:hypothetical protein